MKVVFKDVSKFRKIIIQKGYSQRKFSREIDLSETYFHQILHEKKNPSPKVAKRIADKLGYTFDDIFTIK